MAYVGIGYEGHVSMGYISMGYVRMKYVGTGYMGMGYVGTRYAWDMWALGNGMGNPAGIASETRTRPVAQPYPQPHGFTRQKESKNVQIGPELKEIQPISMNFAKSAVTPSVLSKNYVFGLVWKLTGRAIVTRTHTRNPFRVTQTHAIP